MVIVTRASPERGGKLGAGCGAAEQAALVPDEREHRLAQRRRGCPDTIGEQEAVIAQVDGRQQGRKHAHIRGHTTDRDRRDAPLPELAVKTRAHEAAETRFVDHQVTRPSQAGENIPPGLAANESATEGAGRPDRTAETPPLLQARRGEIGEIRGVSLPRQHHTCAFASRHFDQRPHRLYRSLAIGEIKAERTEPAVAVAEVALDIDHQYGQRARIHRPENRPWSWRRSLEENGHEGHLPRCAHRSVTGLFRRHEVAPGELLP